MRKEEKENRIENIKYEEKNKVKDITLILFVFYHDTVLPNNIPKQIQFHP